ADNIKLDQIDPENLYNIAAYHFASIKSSQLNLEAAQKQLAAAKGSLFPTLALGAQLGTNWASTVKEPTNFKITGATPTTSYVQVENNTYTVYQPEYSIQYSNVDFCNQLNNNFRQTISLSLNVPIFNGYQSQTAVKQSKIYVQQKELLKKDAEQKLKQDVYRAVNDATNSVQKYLAAKRSEETARRAFT